MRPARSVFAALFSFPSGSPRATAGVIVLHSLLLWTLTATAAPAPDAHDPLAPLVAELMPLVEAAAGARFTETPEVVLADQTQLAEVLYEEQRHLLTRLTDLTDDEAAEAARASADNLAAVFAGKYGFLDKRLYLSIDVITERLEAQGAPASLAGPMVTVVLAHELAHALQDQHAELEQVVSHAGTADGVMAANCLVEGHAVWVHEQVAASLGLHQASDMMAHALGYHADARTPRDPDAFYTAYVYGLGRDFVDWHTRDGGTERIWGLFAEPPAHTAVIAHPRAWAEGRRPAPRGLARAMRRAARRLGHPDWTQSTQPLGDYDVREQLLMGGAGPQLADRVDSAWHAQSIGGPGLGVQVQTLRFDAPAMAQAYVLNMGRHAAFKTAAMHDDDHVIASAGVFDGIASDVSARESIALSMGVVPQELGTVWLAEGRDVVQIITVNRSPSDRHIARAARPVMRALRKDRRRQRHSPWAEPLRVASVER